MSRDASTHRDKLLLDESQSDKTMNNEHDLEEAKHSFDGGDVNAVDPPRAQAYDAMSADLDLSVDSVDLAGMLVEKQELKRGGSADPFQKRSKKQVASKDLFYELQSQKRTEKSRFNESSYHDNAMSYISKRER